MLRDPRRPSIGSLILLAAVSGCGAASDDPSSPAEPDAVADGKPEDRRGRRHEFVFLTTSGEPITARTVRGRMTVVVFVATFDTASQVQVRFVDNLMHGHTPRINGLVVAMEPAAHGPIVDAFAASLDVLPPVVMADSDTRTGGGTFAVRHVPTLVLLDRDGVEVWRRIGLVEREEIERVISRLE